MHYILKKLIEELSDTNQLEGMTDGNCLDVIYEILERENPLQNVVLTKEFLEIIKGRN